MASINKAVKVADGDLIVDCDSDDYFVDGSFKIIRKYAKELLNNSYLYGLVFLKKEENGKISGEKFKKNGCITTMFDLYFKEDIGGEKIIVYNSKIRKLFLHELEKNEKFVTEARMYHKMDEKYGLLTINKAIEQGSYMEDGYTKNINKTFITSPFGYYMYFKEIMQKDMKDVIFSKRLYAIKHYILFGYLTKNGFNSKIIKNAFNKILYLFLYIPGIIKSIKFKNKNAKS